MELRRFEPGAEDAGDAGARRRDAVGHLPAMPDDNGWLAASRPPAADPSRPGAGVQVLGVINDPGYVLGPDQEPFVDQVCFWPDTGVWKVTHVGRADVDAYDFPVRVVAWQPIPDLPPPWSALWQQGAAS